MLVQFAAKTPERETHLGRVPAGLLIPMGRPRALQKFHKYRCCEPWHAQMMRIQMMCEQRACRSLGTLLGVPQGWALALLHSPVAHVTAATESPALGLGQKTPYSDVFFSAHRAPQKVGAFNPI